MFKQSHISLAHSKLVSIWGIVHPIHIYIHDNRCYFMSILTFRDFTTIFTDAVYNGQCTYLSKSPTGELNDWPWATSEWFRYGEDGNPCLLSVHVNTSRCAFYYVYCSACFVLNPFLSTLVGKFLFPITSQGFQLPWLPRFKTDSQVRVPFKLKLKLTKYFQWML